LQNGFDVLLATSEKVIGDEHYCLPSKLFTYLRSGKPALAFLTKGVQHEFISRSKMGPIADPDNEVEAAAIMEKLLVEGFSASLDMNYLQQFERDKAIQQLLAIVKNAFTQEFNPVTKAVTA
jgi:hypothetical protein